MSEAKMLDESYDTEASDPEKFFKSSFGIFTGGVVHTIKIEFSPKIAPYVKERGWHSTQRVVNKSDGSILFSMEVGMSPEVVQWVLGFGHDATILEPQELRERVVEAASQVKAIQIQLRERLPRRLRQSYSRSNWATPGFSRQCVYLMEA